MADFRILTVCTANICRSPAAATLIRRGAPATISVASAGVAATSGRPACDLATALVGGEVPDHASALVTATDLAAADLILALDRGHRSELASLAPRTRPKTFTLRQAAVLSDAVGQAVSAGRPIEGAPPLPADSVGRLRWWVAEMDAARGLIPLAETMPTPFPVDPLDVPDPHVVGYQYHPMAMELVAAAVADLLSGLQLILDAGAAETMNYSSPNHAELREDL